MQLMDDDNVYMPQVDFERLSKYALKKNDLLLSVVGTVGNAAIVEEENLPTIFSCKSTVIRTKGINPKYLLAYLNSIYGRALLLRKERGAVQKGLNLEDLKLLDIYLPSPKFQARIESTYLDSKVLIDNATLEIEEVSQSLASTLGLEEWRAHDLVSYIRSSCDVFSVERFDAEYFYPAKTDALVTLSTLSDCTVGDLFESVRTLWQPAGAPVGVPVRNYDLSDALAPFLNGAKETVEPEEIASTKKLVQAGDLVVSRLRHYLKEIAIVQASVGDVPMVVSTEYIVLRPKPSTKISVEALMIYLRSQLPQLVFKWSQDGSNHPRFDERELLRLPVPRLLISQSATYVSAVQSMIALRKQATRLLEAAKRAVEIAIEQDEEAGMAYLAREISI